MPSVTSSLTIYASNALTKSDFPIPKDNLKAALWHGVSAQFLQEESWLLPKNCSLKHTALVSVGGMRKQLLRLLCTALNQAASHAQAAACCALTGEEWRGRELIKTKYLTKWENSVPSWGQLWHIKISVSNDTLHQKGYFASQLVAVLRKDSEEEMGCRGRGEKKLNCKNKVQTESQNLEDKV